MLEAFSPLVRGTKFKDPTVLAIAEKHGKSPAQVLIRYALDKGWAPLPKSEKEDRIRANLDVFDFALEREELASLDKLDEAGRERGDWKLE